ncbi:hypothetical protein BDQ94DRAFT_133670 [Aspergillus welwitschiae]|uniref:Uncharacterized protein n=1 Tax=Aspergillus welwitschiae TaxID=1341132 RepID=A0A3F3QLD7_9EURO|nr:hypothetical protein BDQ94DRAFT_133670 [Aspergillus welwitschiae]RDH39780.1 hypothetical protein BDQ94DRAFT_133670 [Aspergillus welwitschiae]
MFGGFGQNNQQSSGFGAGSGFGGTSTGGGFGSTSSPFGGGNTSGGGLFGNTSSSFGSGGGTCLTAISQWAWRSFLFHLCLGADPSTFLCSITDL